jgi:hypothetical protein
MTLQQDGVFMTWTKGSKFLTKEIHILRATKPIPTVWDPIDSERRKEERKGLYRSIGADPNSPTYSPQVHNADFVVD